MTALAAVGASRAQSIMRFMVTRPLLVRETASNNYSTRYYAIVVQHTMYMYVLYEYNVIYKSIVLSTCTTDGTIVQHITCTCM